MRRRLLRVFVCGLVAILMLVASCVPESTDDPSPEVVTEDTSETSYNQVSARISKSGWIREDETWSGTIRITGDVWVDSEVTLTILPGTKVLFAAYKDDQKAGHAVPLDDWISQHDDPTWTVEYAQSVCKLDVYGELVAMGTPDNEILFTSDSPAPDGGDWLHLHIGEGSRIEYCIIEYSRGGLDITEGTGDSVVISNNTIRHNLWTGMTIHNSSPTVTYNRISRSGGHQGIAVIGEGSSPYIAHNVIEECKAGIGIHSGTAPEVENNTLLNNDGGIGVMGPNTFATIRGNSISSLEGPSINWTYKGRPIYYSSVLTGRDDAISGISVVDSSPEISQNEITYCNDTGINIIGNSSPNINNNTIVNNRTGILFDESFSGSPHICQNDIYDNSYSSLSLWSSQAVNASDNWWGTTHIADIRAAILDISGEPALETVVVEPILQQPATKR